MRIVSLVVVAVLALSAGLALRGWSDDAATVAPKPVTALDRARTLRPIRLVPADPGALHRPALRRPPVAVAVPPDPLPGVAAPAPTVSEAPAAPAPETTPQNEPDSSEPPEPRPNSTFDSER